MVNFINVEIFTNINYIVNSVYCFCPSFYSSMTIDMRNREFAQIQNVIEGYRKSKQSTGLYICGVPGSGKTYTIKKALEKTDHLYLNCSSFKTKTGIYKAISSGLKCLKKIGSRSKRNSVTFKKAAKPDKNKQFELLMKHFGICKEEHILILDEVDLLKTKDQSILYNIFSLPTYENISILLITISNSFNLDLDSKILSRQGNKKLLFTPYKNEQLFEILNDDNKNNKDVLNKKEFISRRVAAVSGDARKAIRLYHSTQNLNIEQISRKINESENMLPKQYLLSLTDYHKIFLMKFFHKMLVIDAFSAYNNFCTLKKLNVLDYLEFIQMLSFLKSTGIISISKERINYLFIREEIETYLKQDKVIKLFV